MIELYGLSNCDKVQAAKKWLNENNISFSFHDFKNKVLNKPQITEWIQKKGLDILINKKSITWRNLPDEKRNLLIHEKTANEVLLDYPSIIKRPVLIHKNKIIVGFDKNEYVLLKK